MIISFRDTMSSIKDLKAFTVTNAGNSCYIDSLLVALFLTESHIDTLLSREPENSDKFGEIIMLQEHIRADFVEKIRKGESISGEVMANLRLMFVQAGWLSYMPEEMIFEEILNQQDVTELFIFLMDSIKGPTIDIKVSTTVGDKVKDGMSSLKYIPLSIKEEDSESIKCVSVLLDEYLGEQKKMLHDATHETGIVDAVDKFSISNIPQFIALSINRFHSMEKKMNTMIDINKSICPFKSLDNHDVQDLKYNLHALVCFKGETPHAGHYYTIIYDKTDNTWWEFNDLTEPSIQKVNMNDGTIVHTIASSVAFLIYISSLA